MSRCIHPSAVYEPTIIPSPEDMGSFGPHSEHHCLDDPFEDYLLAKSKTGGTSNYYLYQ